MRLVDENFKIGNGMGARASPSPSTQKHTIALYSHTVVTLPWQGRQSVFGCGGDWVDSEEGRPETVRGDSFGSHFPGGCCVSKSLNKIQVS